MPTNLPSINPVGLLIVIQFSILLVGCGGDPYQAQGDPLSSATVIASEREGINPVDVTFDVSGLSGVTWDVTWDFGDGETASTNGNSSVSHTYTTPGDFTAVVSIADRSAPGSPRVFRLPVTVIPDVNLVVSSFAIDKELTPNDYETISAIIQNVGTDTFTAGGIDTAAAFISVGYYLSTDEDISIDDIYIGDTSIFIGTFFGSADVPFGTQSLAPGENYQYNHQLAVKGNVPAGEYFAGAIVDYIDEFSWYAFPRSTDTLEFTFPTRVVVPETVEDDNARLLTAHKVQVSVSAATCTDDAFEGAGGDDSSATATQIELGETQEHNFCFDNSDWLRFNAIQGNVYKITTLLLGSETDTQLILYDTDGRTILLFHDNIGNTQGGQNNPGNPQDDQDNPENLQDDTTTLDLEEGFPPYPSSEIVWEAQATGTYFIKVRTTACDEDKDDFCTESPDGVGLNTEYSIALE